MNDLIHALLNYSQQPENFPQGNKKLRLNTPKATEKQRW
jgi:hypothetical protein